MNLEALQTVALGGSRGAVTRPQDVITDVEWRRRERHNIRAALERAGGRIYGPGGAAELLGIKPTTLVSRLKALGLRRTSTLRRT